MLLLQFTINIDSSFSAEIITIIANISLFLTAKIVNCNLMYLIQFILTGTVTNWLLPLLVMQIAKQGFCFGMLTSRAGDHTHCSKFLSRNISLADIQREMDYHRGDCCLHFTGRRWDCFDLKVLPVQSVTMRNT